MDLTYKNGSSFKHPKDPCKDCICEIPRVRCFDVFCIPVWCSHPIFSNCCLTCDEGCLFENHIYNELETFQDPKNPCRECVCQEGNIACHNKICDRVSCQHPARDGCCPICSDCFYQNELIQNGQKINQNGSNTCKDCVCTDGNIECHQKHCPEVYCSDPVIKECCPVCDLGCFYEGKIYKFGAEFDHPKDSCSECACMDGSVHCEPKPCEPPRCQFPIADSQSCCPYCSDFCIYENQRYDSNSLFQDPKDACQKCTCLSGDVICEKEPCPEMSCFHPAPGNCCLECEMCSFDGKIYEDGQNFTNPQDSCESCFCTVLFNCKTHEGSLPKGCFFEKF